MKRSLAAALAALFLTGCYAPTLEAPPDWDSKVRMRVSDVQVVSVAEAPAPGGVTKVSLAAQNKVRFERNVRFRAVWFDSNGQPIETAVSNWEARTLAGNEPFEHVFVSPGPRAVSYVIDFQDQ